MRRFSLFLIILFIFSGTVYAGPLFYDSFGDSSYTASNWGNERGDWIASDGKYSNQTEGGGPLPFTYSSVTSLTDLTDFVVDVDICNAYDGGIFLRSTWDGSNVSGILLITVAYDGEEAAFYWHYVVDGIGYDLGGYTPGIDYLNQDVSLRIVVSGNNYSAYTVEDGTPTLLTTYYNDLFASGSVGLYGRYPLDDPDNRHQSFDNFSVSAVPEPATMLLLGSGLVGLAGLRRKFRKS